MEPTKQPKLQLEAGKYYRTTGGRKAFVAAINPMPGYDGAYPVIGCLDDGTSSDVWTLSGHYRAGEETDHDLIAEWVEPKRIKGWVNIYGPAHSNLRYEFNDTREEADQNAASDVRIACIEIDVLEGQGLEGGR